MEPTKNPYAAGPGLRPPAFAGRAPQVAAFDQMLSALGRGGDTEPLVVVGPVASGKTSFLHHCAERAIDAQWLATVVGVGHGAQESLPYAVGLGFDRLVHALTRHRPGMSGLPAIHSALAGFASTVGLEPTVAAAPDPSTSRGRLIGDLHGLLRVLGGAMNEIQRGMVVLVDDANRGTDAELGAIVPAILDAAERGLPISVVLASASRLDPLTRTGRGGVACQLVELGPFSFYDVQEALERPAVELGVGYQHAAVRAIADRSVGSPMLVQMLASSAWDASKTTTIMLDDVDASRPQADQVFLERFVQPLIERLAPGQRRYLRAIADLEGTRVTSAAVARALGDATRFGESSVLAAVRDELVRTGLIWSPDRTELLFTLPPLARALPVLL